MGSKWGLVKVADLTGPTLGFVLLAGFVGSITLTIGAFANYWLNRTSPPSITLTEAHLEREQQVNLIRIEFPEDEKQKPIEREACFYFISIRNEHGPTVTEFQVHFSAISKFRGWADPLWLISPSGKSTFTIPARYDNCHPTNRYAVRNDAKAWFTTVNTSKYTKENTTLFEKGPANHPFTFALFYSLKDTGYLTFPSWTWRFLEIPCKFRLRIFFMGEGLPRYLLRSMMLMFQRWNKFEVTPVVKSEADDES